MPLQAWFPDEIISIEPGASVRLPLTVENPAPHPDGCTITPAGFRASWLTVAQPSIVLDAGRSAVVDVWLHPPPVSGTTAGHNEISVRLVADSEPSLSLTVDSVVDVTAFDDRTLTLAQPIVRGRRRTRFDVAMHNGGNAMAEVRMKLVDPSGRIDGDFDPPAVSVPPGDSATVRLKTRAERKWFRTSDRLLNFEIDAVETGRPTARASAAMLQTKTFNGRFFGRLVPILLTLGLVAAGWMWGARPWIERRIDERVSQELSSVRQDANDVPPAQASPTESNDRSLEAAEDTESVRLATRPAVGTSEEVSYTAEDSTVLLITDLVLQNPQGDAGRATLRLGDEVWYEWRLEAMAGPNEFQPRVTPLRVESGETVTFEAACDTVGNNAETCSVALLMSGRVLSSP